MDMHVSARDALREIRSEAATQRERYGRESTARALEWAAGRMEMAISCIVTVSMLLSKGMKA